MQLEMMKSLENYHKKELEHVYTIPMDEYLRNHAIREATLSYREMQKMIRDFYSLKRLLEDNHLIPLLCGG